MDKLTPAFPRTEYGDDGMALRDWFAGQAIAVMFAVNRDYLAKVSKDPSYPINEATARDAYALADAMMEARK